MTNGKIVKIISNLYTVVSENGDTYDCRARGKFRNDKENPLVGDFVVIDTENKYILKINERKNNLIRPRIANVDIALIVTSVKSPNLSLTLLDKELLCIEKEKITPLICLTKLDLLTMEEQENITNIFDYYKSLGITIVINTEIAKIKKLLKGKTVVLTGQTGSGKSSLLNKLDKTLNLQTNPISKSLGRGIHTTRHTELYDIDGIFIADTPGFSALDIKCSKNDLKELYPEFIDITCKFKDCNHIKENGCMVKELVEKEKIATWRYENYVKFWSEL